ncbi:FG-GAP-like repeat-containing protein [Streptomyces sp. NPDC048290]|uniref:FG-GAP-like repeat-containing protein n=1 Tax=Streptomyces sp. NPDC048290 TaxID=3155811 RepID=UPI00341CBC9A
MGRRGLIRGGTAVGTSLVVAVGLLPAAFTAQAAPAVPAEVVVPPQTSLNPETTLLSAGPSGFLRYEPGRGHVWTTYAGVETVVNPTGAGPDHPYWYGTGSDVVAHYEYGTRTVTLRDMAAGGAVTTIPVPTDQHYRGTLGRTVVTVPGLNSLRLLDRQEDGTVRERVVTGLPADISRVRLGMSPVGDERGAVVQFRAGGATKSGWLDLAQARLVPLPYNPVMTLGGRTVLTSTHFLSRHDERTVAVYARDDLSTPVRTVPLPDGRMTSLVGMVGDTLLVGRHATGSDPQSGDLPLWQLDGIAPDGTTTGTVLARSMMEGEPVSLPGGGVLVTGSPSGAAADWGVQLIEAGADGRPVSREVADGGLRTFTDPIERLDLKGGRLTVVQWDRAQELRDLHSRPVTIAGDRVTLGSPTSHGGVARGMPTPELLGTGDGRTALWNIRNSGGDIVPRVLGETGTLPGTAIDATRAYDRVLEAAGRHVAMPTAFTTAGGSHTRVIDLDSGATVATSAEHATALWGTTMWVKDGNDSAVPVDVRTGKRGASVWFGRGCLLDDLQAVGRWLSWWCVGSREARGVYDTVTRKNLTLGVGSGTSAPTRLGDGFVVTENAGTLTVTDVSTGTPVTRTVATGLDRGLWDVDPYTGLIAYVDASEAIRVVSSGVPLSSLATTDASVSGAVDVKGGATLWNPRWWLSKQAASWKLVIRHKATGATVRTLSGGAVRSVVRTSWNGKDTLGGLVPNGSYTWTLTAAPADGRGAALSRTGTVKVTGATPVHRDFIGSDGFGDLLTLSASGGLTYHYGTGTGTLGGKKTGSGWPSSVRAVPFGDLNGDRCNEVLVKLSSGALRAYRPACGTAPTPATPYTSLGTSGWNQYDVLTSPGDLSGDGRPDLIARQTSTGDLYLYQATSTGKLSARVKIASRWTIYKKVIGAGDLNGDGHGDLLVQDRSNELWRYDGTGTGTFKGRVKVFNDWGPSYDVVVGVGDITGDGRADLVARDTAGTLWRSNGNGKGSFGGRVKISGGWQAYKGVF